MITSVVSLSSAIHSAWNSWPRHCVLNIGRPCEAGYRLTMLLDISNCVPFVLSWRNETLTVVLFSVIWQQFLLFKNHTRNGPELCERRGYVSNHLHDRCCAMSLWEMLCVCVVTCERVHSCAKKKKKKKKVQGQSQHGLFSGRSINCSANLQIIILLYTCINRCLVSAGENVPLSLARFVHFGQLTFTSNNREKGFYLWLVKQIMSGIYYLLLR